ncbi:hypothetical protein GPECTOR_6g765 [Gonium pectorale]|uniref:Uncharacterized protein n=1 Tax=Gonium pectorale TaxID=33097 RepID=A0A150GVE0_GONPE|nr:hypothetical protein GPECTOR_6g765 [Gonium pectorale]|eukprot:KXZ53847.1 hypothetical protein GPECTOR_6g765 [Gonium pectorale]
MVKLQDEMRPVEEYIPFGFVELKGKLVNDHPEVFSDPETRRKFDELCKWMSLRNTLRLALDYGDAHDKYAPLDPDKDTLAFKMAATTAAAGGQGYTAGKAVVPSETIHGRVAAFNKELSDIVEKAEFEELPLEDLEKVMIVPVFA